MLKSLKKTVILFCFITTITHTGHSQSHLSLLSGDWVCIRVEDLQGTTTTGAFGDSDEYLRFSFSKKYLLIAEAPFDRGLNMPITITNNSIEVFSEQLFDLPELKFTIKSITENDLVLYSNSKGKEVLYFLKSQKNFQSISKDSIQTIDCGLIIINEVFVSTTDNPMFSYKSFDYRISNAASTLSPCPMYKDRTYFNLGSYLSLNFKFPKAFKAGTLSDEIVIQIKIGKYGIEESKILKPLDLELNSTIFDLVVRSSKKWIPVRLEKKVIHVNLRFHFRFLQTLSK
jgi:hypothetical protein